MSGAKKWFSKRTFGKVDDLIHSIEDLALGAKKDDETKASAQAAAPPPLTSSVSVPLPPPPPPPPPLPARPPPTSAPQTHAFVGGFNPGYISPDTQPSLSFPVPFIPSPPRRTSLTMQHALSAPQPTYPGPAPSRPALSLFASPDPRPASAAAAPIAPKPNTSLSVPVRRASSDPSSPSSSSGSALQCSGVTKANKRCTRIVKSGPPLLVSHPSLGEQLERYCFQHRQEVMQPSGFYSRRTQGVFVEFKDYIPHYLHPETQVALRVEMERPQTKGEEDGYIYTFEIRDPKSTDRIMLKVGRSVNVVKRLDQWDKQCSSKEQVLRGWWPSPPDAASLMKGRVQAAKKGKCCHRLERLVHLELADLAMSGVYLDPKWPNVPPREDEAGGNGSGSGSGTPSRKGLGKGGTGEKCEDCGTVHKEIFVFVRVERGKCKGKEWEEIVRPVIEKWGRFVETHV